MINRISFRNYKSFIEKQTLELPLLTILIGKNSSGKSAIVKLPTLIENSFSSTFPEPFSVVNNGVELGAEYRDIVYGRQPSRVLELEFTTEERDELNVQIAITGFEKGALPKIIRWELTGIICLKYDDSKKCYINEIDGRDYTCEFNGLRLELLLDKTGEGSGDVPETKNFKIKTSYIGPLRVFAQKMRFFSINKREQLNVGNDGADAYRILAAESLKNQSSLLTELDTWFKANFGGWGLGVDSDKQPIFEVYLYRGDPSPFKINIADVGQGMSQALPLIVSALLPNKDLTIIEQPELHLHPAAHGDLAQLFAETALRFGKKYLIETHSPNFVLRLRRLVAEGNFKKENLAIYWVDYDEEKNASSLRKIEVSDLGEVSGWPENVFSETLDETLAIRSAQLKNSTDGN